MNKVSISLKKNPPKIISRATAVIAFLLASQSAVVDNLPIDNLELKKSIADWYTYTLQFWGVVIPVACIMLGVSPKPEQEN